MKEFENLSAFGEFTAKRYGIFLTDRLHHPVESLACYKKRKLVTHILKS